MDLQDFVPTQDHITVELGFKDAEGNWIKKMTNDDGTTMTVTVLSPFSKEAKKIVYDINDKRIKDAARKKEKTISTAEAEDVFVDTLVTTTVDWNITWGGEKPKFDKGLAKEVYTKAFWIRNLVEEEKGKTLDFMKA